MKENRAGSVQAIFLACWKMINGAILRENWTLCSIHYASLAWPKSCINLARFYSSSVAASRSEPEQDQSWFSGVEISWLILLLASKDLGICYYKKSVSNWILKYLFWINIRLKFCRWKWRFVWEFWKKPHQNCFCAESI